MPNLTVVLGFGAVGRSTVTALLARGDAVCVAQRRRPADRPAGATLRGLRCARRRIRCGAPSGAAQIVLAVGFAYDRLVWRKAWPKTMTNVIAAGAAMGARIVFVDNLYMLGPQRSPRREDMALSKAGAKAAILSKVTRIWMKATDRVRIAALRCTDFYGPGVPVSHLGTTGFGAIAQGKPALMLAPPDTPHDFAYVPDIARAVITLLDAPDDAFGQVWNMPCAPTRTPREILRLGADARPMTLKIRHHSALAAAGAGRARPSCARSPTSASPGTGPMWSMAVSSRGASASS